MFCLAFTLMLRLALLHVLFLSSLMDLTIAHMVLVHERTSLSRDVLVTAHVLIVVIVSHVGLVFLLRALHPLGSKTLGRFTLSPLWFMSHSTKWCGGKDCENFF
jgi:hypothetical protein